MWVRQIFTSPSCEVYFIISIKTNLLFFDKGAPTKQIWYFEHPYPKGYKSYSRSNPLTIGEFDLEKKWWNKRKPSEYAWKVTVKEIEDRNYNLDFKNPHVVEVQHGDPEVLMKFPNSLLPRGICSKKN